MQLLTCWVFRKMTNLLCLLGDNLSLTIFFATIDFSFMLTSREDLPKLNPLSAAAWPWLNVKIILTTSRNLLHRLISSISSFLQ